MKPSLGWLGAALVVLALGACGGKVVVDQDGNGGGGGEGASSPASGSVGSGPSPANGTGTSTASGPGCGCQDACGQLRACGFSGDCGTFCAQAPPELVQCICSTQGCGFENCMGSSGQTSGSSGETGAGGTGGGFPGDCATCVNAQVDGPCAMLQANCDGDPACNQLLQCMESCNWTNPCIEMCVGPGAGSAFYSLVNCAVCSQCFGPCRNSSLIQFCLDG